MTHEIVFVFILTFLLVTLLVPVARFRTWHSQTTQQNTSSKNQRESDPNVIGVGMTMLFFFFLLFPLILAGALWIGPFGPELMGVSWVPMLIIGSLLSLLIAALSPRERRPFEKESSEAKEPENPLASSIAALFGTVFFFLMFFSALVILVALI